jgi:hypothetical protein
VARFGRLDSSSNHSYACSLVHSELSWRGLKSSLHLHGAHMHCGSHYSVRSPYHLVFLAAGAVQEGGASGRNWWTGREDTDGVILHC